MGYPTQSLFTHPGGYTTRVPGTLDPSIDPVAAREHAAWVENQRALAEQAAEDRMLAEYEQYGRELSGVERMLGGPSGSEEMVGNVARAIYSGGVGGGLAAGPVAGAAGSILGSGARRGARITPSGEPALLLEDPRKLDYVPAHAQQRALERYQPPRGDPKTIAPLFDPRVQELAEEATERGIERGATAWYNLDPLYGVYTDELGEAAGTAAFSDFTQRVGATSPQAKVYPNIQRAMWADWEGRMGGGTLGKDPSQSPVAKLGTHTYGSMRAPLHAIDQGIDMPTRLALLRGELPEGTAPSKFASLFPLKTPSFAENLRGNMMPSTVDIHNMRGWAHLVNQAGAAPDFAYGVLDRGADQPWLWGGSTTSKLNRETGEYDRVFSLRDAPSATEYPGIERANAQVASTLGIEPGQTQAGMWMGLSDITGVADDKIFMQAFNDALGTAAKARGVDPKTALIDFIHGRHRLYSQGANPVSPIMGPSEEDDLGPLP